MVDYLGLAEETLEDIERLKSIKKMKQRSEAYLNKVMSIVAPVVKSWYLRAGVEFLKNHQLKEEDEEIFADFTEFCTERLDDLSKRALRLKNRNLSEVHL